MKVAVTGHRPNKLGNAYDLMHPFNIQMGNRMREFILTMAGWNEETHSFRDKEDFTIISGMALGVDTVWAMVALKLKRQFPHKFQLECAIPCREQERKWNKESQERYRSILSQADKITYITETTYTPNCMQKRNEYMVNNCDYLYCVWNGTAGGTKNCMDYAKEKGTLMYIENPKPWLEKFSEKEPVH